MYECNKCKFMCKGVILTLIAMYLGIGIFISIASYRWSVSEVESNVSTDINRTLNHVSSRLEEFMERRSFIVQSVASDNHIIVPMGFNIVFDLWDYFKILHERNGEYFENYMLFTRDRELLFSDLKNPENIYSLSDKDDPKVRHIYYKNINGIVNKIYYMPIVYNNENVGTMVLFDDLNKLVYKIDAPIKFDGSVYVFYGDTIIAQVVDGKLKNIKISVKKSTLDNLYNGKKSIININKKRIIMQGHPLRNSDGVTEALVAAGMNEEIVSGMEKRNWITKAIKGLSVITVFFLVLVWVLLIIRNSKMSENYYNKNLFNSL